MEDKDHLKEVLANIHEINEPIDLEHAILQMIQKQEESKLAIKRYKANGIKALIISGVLILVLAILFSLQANVQTIEQSIITYSSIFLILLTLFFQLEMGKTNIFNHIKNHSL